MGRTITPETPVFLSRHPNTLLIAGCLLVWLWSAWRPHEYSTWLIEQVATLLALLVLWWLTRSTPFSRASAICIALMFCIHTIGTHYTYSLTPYNALIEHLTGTSLNDWVGWERNHYDRFVHLSYGLLLALPLIEVLKDRLPLGNAAAAFFMVQIVIASSAVYELMEWSAAIMFGGDLGTAYLGTQGDPWDAQADMALAALGTLLTLMALYARNRLSKGPASSEDPARG